MAHDLQQFKVSPLGRKVGSVLAEPDAITKMITRSERGLPAIGAIAPALMILDNEVGAARGSENGRALGP